MFFINVSNKSLKRKFVQVSRVLLVKDQKYVYHERKTGKGRVRNNFWFWPLLSKIFFLWGSSEKEKGGFGGEKKKENFGLIICKTTYKVF